MDTMLERPNPPGAAEVAVQPGAAEPATVESTALSAQAPPARSGEPHHILYLLDRFYGTHGGAERALLSLIRQMPRDKFRCSVATFGGGADGDLSRLFTCPVHVFPLTRSYDWTALKTAFKLRHLIRSERVSIVHTFFETSDLWGGAVAKLSGCPLLVSSRRDMGILRKRKHDIAYRWIEPFLDLVLTVSDGVRDFTIARDGLDPKKVVTLYNGVDLGRIARADKTDALRASLGIEHTQPVVATVANIRQVKGIDIFIRAAAVVCREFPNARFLVIGHFSEPEYYRQLQELTRELGMTDNVKFLGGNEDTISFLKLANVFCLLSRSEGFSNALLEAMACSLPCVATRVGGNAEAVADGENGFTTDSEDWQAAGERISMLLRTPARARQMGAAGRRLIEERFTLDILMRKLVGLYDGLLAGKAIE
jgi:glycosyltransferase involved in cell wall biosynthesis